MFFLIVWATTGHSVYEFPVALFITKKLLLDTIWTDKEMPLILVQICKIGCKHVTPIFFWDCSPV